MSGEAVTEAGNELQWEIKKVRAKIRNGGKQREFVWEVTCPETPAEPTWENDFGRGMRCGCRRFPTEGKATRYVDRMTGRSGIQNDVASAEG